MSELLTDNGSWNMNLLQNYFWPCDVNEIIKIRASPRLEEDTIAWGPGRFGQFSVKSAYEFAFEEANREPQPASSTNPEGCWAI